jgi:outer membrane protein OmpA-like peptidoglycan-associated protein
MRKLLVLFVILCSLENLQAQEVYFNTGRNYTKYNYQNSSGAPNPNFQSGSGSSYEIGYMFPLQFKNLNYTLGLSYNQYNTIGGDTANTYTWNTEYVGINNSLYYSIFKNNSFDIAAKAGLGLATLGYGKQEINGTFYDLSSQKEFSGLLVEPSVGLQIKCIITKSVYFSLGYNYLKSFNVSNSTPEKLSFTTNQFQLGIHVAMNSGTSKKQLVQADKTIIALPEVKPATPMEVVEKQVSIAAPITEKNKEIAQVNQVPAVVVTLPVTINPSELLNKSLFYFSSKDLSLINIDQEALNQAVAYLKDNPSKGLILNGFSSSDGNEEQNYIISLRRAIVAQEYFILRGIPQNRIKIIGKGSSNPKYPNDTLEGRLKNKRVEIEFN